MTAQILAHFHRAVIGRVNELQSSNTPLLASGQGGEAERSTKCREASADREAGVVLRLKQKENHPVCAPAKEATPISFMGAATPPCCGARRGVLRLIPIHTFIERYRD